VCNFNAGFTNVRVDDSDSLMSMELDMTPRGNTEEEEEEEDEEEAEECQQQQAEVEPTNTATAAVTAEPNGSAAAPPPVAPPVGEERQRRSIHGQDESTWRHLEKFDMNELCARVVVVATKPGG